MAVWRGQNTFRSLARRELQHLATIHPSDRRWQMPFCAALASGLPLLIGASFGHLEFGLVSSMGGLVSLYTPDTPLSHRMVTLMACAFGMSACYALGVMSHFVPVLLVPVLTFIAIVVSMVCRSMPSDRPAACSSSWPPRSAPVRRSMSCRCPCRSAFSPWVACKRS